MLFFYVCASLLTIFMGFRDGTGRNARIRKAIYYIKAMRRAFLLGQVLLGILFFSAYLCLVDVSVVDSVAQRCFFPFSIYIATVFAAFIPYMIPNWEVKSLTSVLVFGPLTIGQPVVIIGTMFYALAPLGSLFSVEVFFIILGCLFCLSFERLLRVLGWSEKAAQV